MSDNALDDKDYLFHGMPASLDDVIANKESDPIGHLLHAAGLATKAGTGSGIKAGRRGAKGASMRQTPAAPPGYDLVAGRTFEIKDYIKSLGGRWDPTEKGWWIPSVHLAKVRAAMSGGVVTERFVCWECGHDYPLSEVATKKGADVASWYCGCTEAVAHAKRRPSFGR